MDIFEKVCKQNVMFDSAKGQLTAYDLWNLSLEALNKIAIATNKKLKESETESFIAAPTAGTALDTLRLDVLKHIIHSKQESVERAKRNGEKRAQLATIKEAMSINATKEILSKTNDELAKMALSLENELE